MEVSDSLIYDIIAHHDHLLNYLSKSLIKISIILISNFESVEETEISNFIDKFWIGSVQRISCIHFSVSFPDSLKRKKLLIIHLYCLVHFRSSVIVPSNHISDPTRINPKSQLNASIMNQHCTESIAKTANYLSKSRNKSSISQQDPNLAKLRIERKCLSTRQDSPVGNSHATILWCDVST